MSDMGKAIVFGGNGYLGRNFISLLEKNRYEVLASDIDLPDENQGYDYRRIDVRERAQLDIIDWDVNLVYLFFGLNGTLEGFSKYRAFVEINEIGLLNILDAIRLSPHRPTVIFPSSRLVYPGETLTPFTEASSGMPRSIYAVNKLACEYYLEIYSRMFEIPFLTIRIGVPYGSVTESEYSYGTMFNFLTQARNGQELTVFGDGNYFRTLSHVADIFQQVELLNRDKRLLNQTYNIAGQKISLKEIANAIAKKYNCRVNHVPWSDEYLKLETGSSLLDTQKLELNIDYKPIYDFESWLESLN